MIDKEPYFLAVSLNPVFQETWTVPQVRSGMTNETIDHRVDIAGKGVNVSRILHQLGESAVHLTQLGGGRRNEFLRMAKNDGVDIRWIDSGTDIRFCQTILDQVGRTTTELVENGHPVESSVEERVMMLYRRLLDHAHTVVISGSKAPGFTDELFPEMTKRAKEKGARVLLDIRRKDLLASLSYVPDVLKINVEEFAQTFLPEHKISENTDLELLPQDFWDQVEAIAQNGTIVTLTNGAQPIVYNADGSMRTAAVRSVTPVNTIGCGDALAAGLAAGLHRDLPFRDALELGIQCASTNATLIRPGTIV